VSDLDDDASYSELIDAHRVRRRQKLLLTAAEVLNERGIRNTTMDHVAQAAGVSKVILYRYFGSKDKLVHAVLAEVVEAILAADQLPADWWTERLAHTLPVARGHAAAMRLLVRHASHDPEFGVHFERLTSALSARVDERQLAIMAPLGDGQGPVDDSVLVEAVTAFLLDAYVRWIDCADPAKDAQFLQWTSKSVRAMIYYWRGLEPPHTPYDRPSR